jgi:DNA-binding winged helix-turn-helix (wHTH) protein/tetratricopeptide (TPR) repeat protein
MSQNATNELASPGVAETPGYAFAGFRLEADGTLLRGNRPIHLPPKELAALRFLVAHPSRVVTPQELREALWGDVNVSADSIPKCVSSLRALLEPEECIQTIYKRGYRFVAEVRRSGFMQQATPPRLAILPFHTGSGVPEYLGETVAEETMARMSGARPATVLVLARDSVFTLARRGLTAQETGEALKADLVLAGTVTALSKHYRLRVEMIRVEDGIQIWVEDLLVERDRMAGLEELLVDRLTFRLGTALAGEAQTQARHAANGSSHGEGLRLQAVAESASSEAPSATESKQGDDRHEAYTIFQKARYEWQTLQRHQMQDGLQHLLRATELDPTLTGARIDLVNLCVTQGFYGFMAPTVAGNIVRRTAESTPDLTAQAAAMLPALGWVRFHVDRNLPAALWSMSLSDHLPHDPWITRVRSMFALSRHQFSEAIDMLHGAIALDPFSPWLQARLAWALHLAGERSESVKQARLALAQFPEHDVANMYGAVILAFNGDTKRAVEVAQELAHRLPYFDLATAAQAYALACDGRGDEARAILERLEWLGRERFLPRGFLPAAYLALGEPDAALAQLRAANESRCPWFFQMLADPRLRALEGRAEFEELKGLLANMEAEATLDEEAAS